MLTHCNEISIKPNRVVVIGAGGFIAREVIACLIALGIEVKRLGRPRLDLLAEGAEQKLIDELRSGDTVFIASAKAPVRDLEMLQDNLKMISVICAAIKKRSVAHVIYLSSDAVYKDSKQPLTEKSCAEPDSLHGVMHLSREISLRLSYSGPLAIVRSTLVYGVNDPHNGYGPNRFIRTAIKGEKIILFGEGEERRDHVDVEDVAELVTKIILHKSKGIINAVSGEVVSFRKVAEFVSSIFETRVSVVGTPRIGAIPHNGLRAFDNALINLAFPGFSFRTWSEGLLKVREKMKVTRNE